jgi:hypothetical protein
VAGWATGWLADWLAEWLGGWLAVVTRQTSGRQEADRRQTRGRQESLRKYKEIDLEIHRGLIVYIPS